ncbi:hypothetical protein BHM03_00016056 [Ensete ventricosum]|nr:hypothetical protein BHM03_00016056 [Ensete ventricosum]
MVSMSPMSGQPRVEGGRPGTTSTNLVKASAPTQPVDPPSPYKHKSRHDSMKSISRVAKGKGPAAPVEEMPAPQIKPQSVMHETWIWLDGEASAQYTRGMQIPPLATDLYTLSSEVLMDRVAKTMVLAELEEVTRQRESLEKELGETSASLASGPAPGPIEEDPFKLLPEYTDMSMADEQPFDDSPSPAKE